MAKSASSASSFRTLTAVLLLALASCDGPATVTLPQSPPADGGQRVTLTSYISDDAGLLSASDRRHITARLREWEQKTNHQMVVATVTDTGGQEIAAFTRDWANARGVGRKGHDDGIVLLISPNQQVARLAVGKGLEARLATPPRRRSWMARSSPISPATSG
ncbi:hypothetical protein GCM10022280_08480 [Sphingomonas swuensis]|uniref:TPM domain-containing protein n=2 Tax=Sphingomonas swuensis TaxID=977800 RepID=A0ABP7SJW8_9SPHN